MSAWAAELALAEHLAWEAGALVMARYGQALAVDYKAGDRGNPVTDADRAANDLLTRGVGRAFADDAILAEESPEDEAAVAARRARPRLWCIDPIDGTREFIAGTGDFAVMIGMAHLGRAVMGVVLQPTLGRLVAGAQGRPAVVKEGQDGAWRPLVPPPPRAAERAVVAVSRSHRPRGVLAALATLGMRRCLPMGSIGLKMGAVARGEADVYASLSTTMCEWDTCAPEAICRAAGAEVSDLGGAPLDYNKAACRTPGGLVASRGGHHQDVLRALADWMARRGPPPGGRPATPG